MKWAKDQQRRKKLAKPAVVGALIELGNCFDLMDTRFTEEAHSGNVSASKKARKLKLDPEAKGLDEGTRQRRRTLAKMQGMSAKSLFALAVRAGIYSKNGQLTAAYSEE
jgi:hypothetical protein